MTKKIILHLCADIGSDTHYFDLDSDFQVIKIGKDIGVENFNCAPFVDKVHGICANPPCTQFSTAGGFNKNKDVSDGLFLLNHCKRIINEVKPSKFWVIENPANGTMKDFLGNPDLVYQPYNYGDAWSKKTALWGSFIKPLKTHTWDTCQKIDSLYIRPGRTKPSLAFLHKSSLKDIPQFKWAQDYVQTDADLRSLGSDGFAKQFYLYNK